MITGTPRLARWCVHGRPATSLFPAHANSFPFVLAVSALQCRPATRSQALAVHSLYIVWRQAATLFVVHSCSRPRRSTTVQQTVVPDCRSSAEKLIYCTVMRNTYRYPTLLLEPAKFPFAQALVHSLFQYNYPAYRNREVEMRLRMQSLALPEFWGLAIVYLLLEKMQTCLS